MRLFLMLILMINVDSHAGVTVEHIDLKPRDAFCKGFKFSFVSDLAVHLEYPYQVDDNWIAAGTLVEYQFHETPVFITKSDFEKSSPNQRNVVLGFRDTLASGGDALVSILYKCSKGCGIQNKRYYTIPSVVNYIKSDVNECL